MDGGIRPAANPTSAACRRLLSAGQRLSKTLQSLKFSEPVAYVYNPLTYAWSPYAEYLRRYARGPKRVVFLGMNPGPFGMVQTGVPFGAVPLVRDWLGIRAEVSRPEKEHPRRPIQGFDCPRCEISGHRLWGLFAQRFGTPAAFFREHLVINYCPLAFVESTGRNRTPDKLPASERTPLLMACDKNLRTMIDVLQPEWLIGVGDFACKRAQELFSSNGPRIGRILHPSPASPAANRNWAEAATAQLVRLGVWADTEEKL